MNIKPVFPSSQVVVFNPKYSAVTCLRSKPDVGDAFSKILATWARQTGLLALRKRIGEVYGAIPGHSAR
jgi:hypothetical protein